MGKSIATALLFVVLQGCTPAVEPSPAQISAASDWLSLVDAGRFDASWQNASEVFQTGVSLPVWASSAERLKSLFGGPLNRRLASATVEENPAGSPDGDYLILRYDSAFTNKQSAIETLSLVEEAPGVWSVAGYWIK